MSYNVVGFKQRYVDTMKVSSHPVSGLHGYTAWKVIGRSKDNVGKQVFKIATDAGVSNSSFTYATQITDGEHTGWYCSVGYTVIKQEN